MHLERDGRGRITRKLEQVVGGELREYDSRYDAGGKTGRGGIGSSMIRYDFFHLAVYENTAAYMEFHYDDGTCVPYA